MDLAFQQGPIFPEAAISASLFCEVMCDFAIHGGSAACDKISSTGGTRNMTRLLECFADEKDVTLWACKALYFLAEKGSEAVKANIRSAERDCLGGKFVA